MPNLKKHEEESMNQQEKDILAFVTRLVLTFNRRVMLNLVVVDGEGFLFRFRVSLCLRQIPCL